MEELPTRHGRDEQRPPKNEFRIILGRFPKSKNRSRIEKVADSFFSAAAFNWADNGFARKVKEHGVDPVTVGKLVKGWQVFLQLCSANHQPVVYW